jgi:hypothetical protein
MISSGVSGFLRHRASITWLSAAEIFTGFFTGHTKIQLYYAYVIHLYFKKRKPAFTDYVQTRACA